MGDGLTTKRSAEALAATPPRARQRTASPPQLPGERSPGSADAMDALSPGRPGPRGSDGGRRHARGPLPLQPATAAGVGGGRDARPQARASPEKTPSGSPPRLLDPTSPPEASSRLTGERPGGGDLVLPRRVEWHNHLNGVLGPEAVMKLLVHDAYVGPAGPGQAEAAVAQAFKRAVDLLGRDPSDARNHAVHLLLKSYEAHPPAQREAVLQRLLDAHGRGNDARAPGLEAGQLGAVHFDVCYALRRALRKAPRDDADAPPSGAVVIEAGNALLAPGDAQRLKERWRADLREAGAPALVWVDAPEAAADAHEAPEPRRPALQLLREVLAEPEFAGRAALRLSNRALTYEHTRQVFARLADGGIGYAELEGDVPLSVRELDGLERTYGVEVRFLAGLSTELLKTNTPAVIERGLRKERAELLKPRCVGIDIRGPEAGFETEAVKSFLAAAVAYIDDLDQDRPAGAPLLTIRLHVGEGDTRGLGEEPSPARTGMRAQASHNIAAVLDALADVPEKMYHRIRLGHLTHLAGSAQTKRLRALEVAVEANLGSNYATLAAGSLDETPILHLLLYDFFRLDGRLELSDLALTLDTDGPGVMGTSPAEESRRARDLFAAFKSSEAFARIQRERQGEPYVQVRPRGRAPASALRAAGLTVDDRAVARRQRPAAEAGATPESSASATGSTLEHLTIEAFESWLGQLQANALKRVNALRSGDPEQVGRPPAARATSSGLDAEQGAADAGATAGR